MRSEAVRRERENQQLVAASRAAELAFLKTQLNPHFLYNTLNMLYGLAYGVDKPLANGLLKLSELMRYMLRDTPDGRVDLRGLEVHGRTWLRGASGEKGPEALLREITAYGFSWT